MKADHISKIISSYNIDIIWVYVGFAILFSIIFLLSLIIIKDLLKVDYEKREKIKKKKHITKTELLEVTKLLIRFLKITDGIVIEKIKKGIYEKRNKSLVLKLNVKMDKKPVTIYLERDDIVIQYKKLMFLTEFKAESFKEVVRKFITLKELKEKIE